METKPKDETNKPKDETKPKRGRKSKKELMASLGIQIVEDKDIVNSAINLNINELPVNKDESDDDEDEPTTQTKNQTQKVIKKRGRKPKGGKIIQQPSTIINQFIEKPNVILHLKCSMKDLQTNNQHTNFMDTYNNSELNYELVGIDNITTINNFNLNKNNYTDIDDNDDEDNDSVNKDSIWKKLKQLEHNLHINNINNKKSACFWDTFDFDNPPVYIPKHFINNTYNVYGCFCSPECAVAYLINERIDSSAKFERYHLLNNIYAKIYDYKKNIKPAPNPYYMLDKYCGNLSIQEYRSLLRNERLFLIVDKPLTRMLPELHEDNDEFILNNKIIPSNTYQLKSRLQKKKQNKNNILNEKFGITVATNCE